jgi:hypothetical protein
MGDITVTREVHPQGQDQSVNASNSVNRILAQTYTSAKDPCMIDSRLELFVDDYLIDTLRGVSLKLHSPQRREVAIVFDKPWEGAACGYPTVFQDGDIYRMYYLALGMVGTYADFPNCYGPEVTGYAQSTDGIHWTKPDLNLFEGDYTSRYKKKFTIPKRNNIVWVGQGRLVHTTHNFTPFKDPNPDCKPDARYKAFGRISEGKEDGWFAFQSADAIRWSLIQEDTVILNKGRTDTQPAIFWDVVRKQYVEYHRGDMPRDIRDVITSTSKDFIHWTEPVKVTYGDTPVEQIYSAKVLPYFRAPHIYLGFPMRLVTGRVWVKGYPEDEISDAVFMSSRDGVRFDRRFMEAWIRPGLDPERKSWIHGNTEPVWGILQTAPGELSVYWVENRCQFGTNAQLRRGTLRTDGFVSVHADYKGGELLTKPLSFAGRQLVINFSTSAAGSVQVEVQGTQGRPIEGFTLADSVDFYGDAIEHVVQWKGGSDVSKLAGEPIRLRFAMKDADLYSLRFQ